MATKTMYLGSVSTVGELRNILRPFMDECPIFPDLEGDPGMTQSIDIQVHFVLEDGEGKIIMG